MTKLRKKHSHERALIGGGEALAMLGFQKSSEDIEKRLKKIGIKMEGFRPHGRGRMILVRRSAVEEKITELNKENPEKSVCKITTPDPAVLPSRAQAMADRQFTMLCKVADELQNELQTINVHNRTFAPMLDVLCGMVRMCCIESKEINSGIKRLLAVWESPAKKEEVAP